MSTSKWKTKYQAKVKTSKAKHILSLSLFKHVNIKGIYELKTPSIYIDMLSNKTNDHLKLQIVNIKIKPAVADDASGDAGAEDVEKVFQSNNDLLESGAKTNSVDSIGKAALVIVDALPKNVS